MAAAAGFIAARHRLRPAVFQPRARLPVLWAVQAATVAAYSLIIAFALPQMWLHPFAPLVKNLPILALLAFLWHEGRLKK